MSKLFNLKARYYLILFFLMIVLDVLLCVFLIKSGNKTLNTVCLIVAFLLTGTFFDLFVNKLFKNKREREMYQRNTYVIEDNIEDKLTDYSKRDLPFGTVYSKVVDKCLYKVTIIKSIEKYHSYDPNSDDKHKKTPGVDSATAMMGIELFMECDEDLLRTIKGYTISTGKLYYSAMYYSNGRFVEENHEAPVGPMVEKHQKFYEALGIKIDISVGDSNGK